MQATGGRRRIHNEINITPLTDVFLVLLIIMMLLQTSASLRYAGQIHPPEVNGAENVKQADQNCIIEITGKGPNGEPEMLSVDKHEVAMPTTDETKAALDTILKDKARAADKAKLLLRADKDASSDSVLNVIDAIQAAAGDDTLSTTHRQFLGTVNISVETLINAPTVPAPAEPASPATPPAPGAPQ